MVIPDNDKNGRNTETKLTEQTVENNIPKNDMPNNEKTNSEFVSSSKTTGNSQQDDNIEKTKHSPNVRTYEISTYNDGPTDKNSTKTSSKDNMQDQTKQITTYIPKCPTIQTQVEDESECKYLESLLERKLQYQFIRNNFSKKDFKTNNDTTSDRDKSPKTPMQYPDNQESDKTMTNQKEMNDNKNEDESQDKNDPNLELNTSDRKIVDNKNEDESQDKNDPNLELNTSDRKIVDTTAHATKSMQEDDSKSTDILKNSQQSKCNTQIKHVANNPYISMGAKRNTNSINLMNNLPRKKPMTNYGSEPVYMVVEGYAFHDDIIGVTHRRSNGNEAYNLILRNMVFDNELEDDGFSAYMAMQDISSGKNDQILLDDKGYPRFVFMSINTHHFNTAFEGREAVKKQCEKLRAVSTNIHIANEQLPSLNTYTIVILPISYITGCSISNTQYFQLCI